MEGPILNPPEIYVPEEIVFDILSRKSAKSVIKHASLLYNTLLSQPHFILKQTTNSSTFNGGFFVQRTWFRHGDENTHLTFNVIPNQTPTRFGIPKNSNNFLNQRTRIKPFNQCLLIFSNLVNSRIYICNPVTKTFLPIPYPTNLINICELSNEGFVLRFNPGNRDFPNDHILVATVSVDIEDDPRKTGPHLAVYRNRNWAEETCDLRRSLMIIRHDKPAGLFSGIDNGLVVHFLYNRYDSLPNDYEEFYVAAYEIRTMSLLMTVKLPARAWIHEGEWVDYGPWVNICSFGESLGLVKIAGRRIIVWVLEKHTSVRWRMVVDKTVSNIGVLENEGDVHSCCVVNGKGFLLATLNQIYFYEMEGPNAGRFEVVGKHSLQDDEPPFWLV